MSAVYLMFYLYLYRNCERLKPSDVAVLIIGAAGLGCFDLYAWYHFLFVS